MTYQIKHAERKSVHEENVARPLLDGNMSLIVSRNAKQSNHFGRHLGIFLKKKLNMPYNPEMLLLIYPNELKSYVHTNTRTVMSVAALCTLVKTQINPTYPSVGN